MAKQKGKQSSAASSKDAKRSAKDARIKHNAVLRANRHTVRMNKQKACPKRGKARALRRYSDGVSREWPKVLTRSGYTMSMVFKGKRKQKEQQPSSTGISINGKPMGSMAEALWTVRHLAEQRKAAQPTALAS